MKSLIKRTLRHLVERFAGQVKKNELFEQPGERVKHKKIEIEPEQHDHADIGKAVSIKAFLQQEGWVFLHHWASWCDGCMEEIPLLLELSSWLQEHSVYTKGVCWELFNGTPPQHALPVVQHIHEVHSFPFQSVLIKDAPEDFFALLDIREELIPQFGLYKDGNLVYSHVGVLNKKLIQKIQDIVMERASV